MSLFKSIFPRVLFQEKSPIYGTVEVVQKGDERELLVNGVRQSVSVNASNIDQRYWSKMAELTYDYRGRRIEKFLILGLGGGTVVHFIHRRFPGALVDGVEIDPLILEVGKKYFDLDRIPNLKPIGGDAFDVVDNPDEYGLRVTSYDLVFVDVFQGGTLPSKFQKNEFFENLKKLLSPRGLLAYNQTARSARDISWGSIENNIPEEFVQLRKEEVGASLGFSNFLNFVYYLPKHGNYE